MLTWFRKKMKVIIITVAVLFIASLFYGIGYRGLKGDSGGGQSNEIAKVNGRAIDPLRYREILTRIAQNAGPNIGPQELAYIENLTLGQAIDFTLLLGEARKKVRVSGGDVDAAVSSVMQQQQIPSKRELERALKQMGLDMGKFRDMVKEDIYVQKLNAKLQEEVRLTPDDLREVQASHILVSREAVAKDLLAQLKKGADFASLARRYSLDPGSASKGGSLGYFTTGMMVPEFEKAVFALKVGELGDIVKTDFGYHLIKVTDSRLRKFPGAGKEIEQAALREKTENSYRQWYNNVRSKAKIEIISPEFLANNYRFRGMTAQAIAEYKKAIQQNPANPYLRVFLADTYMQAGLKDLAMVEYENAVKMEGANPDLYIILGKAYSQMGEMKLAAAEYRKASLVAGDNKELHEKLLKLFQTLKLPSAVAREQAELKRIAKKERFEKELTGN